MNKFNMFITAVCVLFLLGLIWRTYTEFHICFPGLFVSKVRISHFPFSRILCVLYLFNFVMGAKGDYVCVPGLCSFFHNPLQVSLTEDFFHAGQHAENASFVQCSLQRSCYALSAWTFGAG